MTPERARLILDTYIKRDNFVMPIKDCIVWVGNDQYTFLGLIKIAYNLK
jgi:hypothetical protein